MSITELLAAIGDEGIKFQNLDHCAMTLDWTRKSGSKITFGTEEAIIPGEGTERLGLVVWLDRKAVAEAIAKGPREGERSEVRASQKTPPEPPQKDNGQ